MRNPYQISRQVSALQLGATGYDSDDLPNQYTSTEADVKHASGLLNLHSIRTF